MRQLQLQLLGPMTVSADGQVLDLRLDRARALLAYLALEPGRAHRREGVAALLWPEAAPAAAATNLRQHVARLRRALGDLDARVPVLIATRRSLALNPEARLAVDVWSFDCLLARARGHGHAPGGCEDCAAWLAEAAGLYGGEVLADVLLGGSIAFEEWSMLHREQRHQDAVFALGWLADHHLARGEPDQAAACARRSLGLDVWRESSYRQLMRALAAGGHRSAALQAYDACVTALRDELGIAPAADTEALREAIVAGRAGLAALAGAPAELPARPAPDNLPTPLTPFIGRQALVRSLRQALAAPDYRLITLVGLGGAGKSRLALHVAALEKERYPDGVALVDAGTAPGNEGLVSALAAALGLPLALGGDPAAQLKRYLAARRLLVLLDGMDGHRQAVGLLLDWLAAAPGLVLLATCQRPCDVQAETVFEVPGLAVPEPGDAADLAANEAVRLFLDRARRVRKGLAPGPDDLAAIAEICRAVAGLPLAIELAASHVARMEPREIDALLRRDLSLLATTMRDVPDRQASIHTVLDRSWALLDSAEQGALAGLAVFAGPFGEAAALAVAGADWQCLARLADQSLLRRRMGPAGGPHRAYSLHPLVRRHALERLARRPADRLAVFGRHAAHHLGLVREWTPALASPGAVEVLAQLGELMPDIVAAWRWASRRREVADLDGALAGLLAYWERRGPPREGERLLGATELLAARSPDWPGGLGEALLARLGVARGRLAMGGGAAAAALPVLERAGRRAEAAGARAVEAEARVLVGRSLTQLGRPEEAARALLGGLRLAKAENLGGPAADALAGLAQLAIHRFHIAPARRRLARALARSVAARDLGRQAQALYLRGMLEVNARRPAAAAADLAACQALLRDLGDSAMEANALNVLGVAELERGRWPAAARAFGASMALQQDVGNLAGECRAGMNLGRVHLILGANEAAVAALRRAEEQAAAGEIGPLAAGLATFLSVALVRTGELDAALAQAARAVALAEGIAEATSLGLALTAQAGAREAVGELAAAAADYARALALFDAGGREAAAREAQAGLARVRLSQGRLPEAAGQVEALLAYLEREPEPGVDGPLGIYAACCEVLRALGDERFGPLLARARRLLQRWSERLDDPGARETFLTEVPAHRALLALAEASLPGPGLPWPEKPASLGRGPYLSSLGT